MRHFLLLLLLLSWHSVLFGQTRQPASYNDPIAYEVYSAILSSPGSARTPVPQNFVIRQRTLKNFGAYIDPETGHGTCLRPDAGSERITRAAIEDYIRINKTTWLLQEKFKLETPYQLISSVPYLNNTQKEDWEKFYRKYPGSEGFFDLSAVGFNADKTVAVVSKGRWCGPLCGEGEYHILQKKGGQWIPLDWKGTRCHWIS